MRGKDSKAFKTIIGVFGAGIVATGAGVGIALTMPKEENSTEVEQVVVSRDMLDRLNLESIQKHVIDNFGSTKQDIKPGLDTYTSNIINHYINTRIIEDTKASKEYLEISLKKEDKSKFQFIFSSDVHSLNKKYWNDGKKIYILLTDESNQKLKYFSEYDITNVDGAYQALVNKINEQNNRFTEDEFKNKINEAMNAFYDALWMNGTSFDKKLATTTFDTETKQVYIKLDTDYKKYKFENTGDVNYNGFDTISINNLNFYTSIQVSITTDLQDQIQQIIKQDDKKYTADEVIENLDEIEPTILQAIPSLQETDINSITLSPTNDLIITLETQGDIKYDVKNTSNNIEFEEVLINGFLTPRFVVKKLEYYTLHTINDASKAFNALVESINQKENRYSIDYFNDNLDKVMTPFYESLKLDETKFDTSIANNSFDKNKKQVTIQLHTDLKKYEMKNTTNVTFNKETSQIQISNLDFYAEKTITINDDLFTSIQNLILDTNKKLTIDELKNSEESLKQTIATNINGVEVADIANVSIDDSGNISFILVPEAYTKYVSNGTSKNVTCEDVLLNKKWTYKFTISKLDYYTSYAISDTPNAFNALRAEIDSWNHRYTLNEFNDKFNDENTKTEIMNKIYDALKMNGSSFNAKGVTSTFDTATKTLYIHLVTDLKKYSVVDSNEKIYIDESGSSIVIPNIDFYSENNISIKEELKTTIQTFIDQVTNRYSLDEMNTYLSSDDTRDIKNEIVNSIEGITENNIDTMVAEDSNLFIQLKTSDYNRYKLDESQLPENVQFIKPSEQNANSYIKVSGLEFYTIKDITNVQEAYNQFIAKIDEQDNRYTVDEFETNFTNTIKVFYDNLSGFEETFVSSSTFDKENRNVSIKLKDDQHFKYVINNIGNELVYDKASTTININGLEFYTKHEYTIDSNLSEWLQDYIKQDSRKYTIEQFELKSNELKTEFANKINGLEADQIINIEVLDKHNVSITLNITDSNKTKNIFNNLDNNVSIQNDDLGFYKILIPNIKFYKDTWLLNENQLNDLWNNVNNHIKTRNVKLSSDPSLDTYGAEKAGIFNVISTTPVADGKTLADFIGDPEQSISRNLANLTIKLDNNTTQDEFVKVEKISLNEGYIVQNPETNTLSLNNLFFSSPSSYFTGTTTWERITEKGKQDKELYIPFTVTTLGEKAVGHLGEERTTTKAQNLFVPDSVTTIMREGLAECPDLLHAKLSKSIKLIPFAMINNCDNMKTMDIYEGPVSCLQGENFAHTGLVNVKLPRTLVDDGNFVDGSSSYVFSKTFNANPKYPATVSLETLTTYMDDINSLYINGQSKIRRINILAQRLYVQSRAFDVDENGNKPQNLYIYVLNEEVKQKIASRCSFPSDRIIVDKELASKI